MILEFFLYILYVTIVIIIVKVLEFLSFFFLLEWNQSTTHLSLIIKFIVVCSNDLQFLKSIQLIFKNQKEKITD